MSIEDKIIKAVSEKHHCGDCLDCLSADFCQETVDMIGMNFCDNTADQIIAELNKEQAS